MNKGSTEFWDVTPSSLVNISLSSNFFLWPEEEDSTFLRNVDKHLSDYMRHIPEHENYKKSRILK
jgi:hypothetical protein